MTAIELAQAIEDAIGCLRDDNLKIVDYGPRSRYTCDVLARVLGGDTVFALMHRIAPQITINPFLAFDEIPAGVKRQYARALWLTLLAELAERGELTLEGLQ